jgi:hypothetical protein
MAKTRITKEDKKEFKDTLNGQKKVIWMIVGMLIDFLATLGISLLHIFSDKLPSSVWFYGILFVLLVIVVLGGEMIGVYYGALEQFVFEKRNKKKLEFDE